MRIISIILTVTVLFLSFKPCIDYIVLDHGSEITCCTDSCEPTSENEEPESNGEKGDCTGNSCNPFQSCGINSVMTIVAFETENQNNNVISDQNFNYQFNIHSQFLSDFWQPPRFA